MPGDAGEEQQQLEAEEHNEEAPHLASIISDEPPSVASPPLYSAQPGGARMPATLNYLTVRDALPAVVITLNRPEQLNALSTGLMKELTAELDGRPTPTDVRVP